MLLLQIKGKVKAIPYVVPAAVRSPPSESESDSTIHIQLNEPPSDADTSLGSRSRAADDVSHRPVMEQSLSLATGRENPMQRQKDMFIEFIKEVAYTFPPLMWVRFQSEVNSVLQRYQLELLQAPPGGGQQQQPGPALQ